MKLAPSFWLLLAGVWCLDPTLLLPAFLAAAVHELGHCAALKALGGRLACLRLSAVGAELTPAGLLSYAQELPVALAGPGASLLCAAVCAHLGRYLLAGLSLALGLFNLLPIGPLDGGRALKALCALILPSPLDRSLPKWVGVGMAGVLLGAAIGCFARFGGLSLLVLALWLGWRSILEHKNS